MKALYNHRICTVVDVGHHITLADRDRQFTAEFSDSELIVDPTDSQLAGAENLGEWYGLEHEAVDGLRAMLRGESSATERQG